MVICLNHRELKKDQQPKPSPFTNNHFGIDYMEIGPSKSEALAPHYAHKN